MPPTSLEDRVAQLERAQAMAQPGYSPTPGMVVNADGSIEYDFDGRIRARGLDLTAGTGALSTSPLDRRVRWLRASDGAAVAELYGREVAGGGNLQLSSVDPSNLNRAVLALTSTPAEHSIVATAQAAQATVIDSDGWSGFVRTRELSKFALDGVWTVDSGVLEPGDSVELTITHNWGRPVYPVAAPQNIQSGAVIGWAYSLPNANEVDFGFYNNGPEGFTARLRLNVFLLADT